VLAELAGDRKTCLSSRIAVGSVAGAPLRARRAETGLEGQNLSRADVRRDAARSVAEELRPVAHHGYSAGHLRHCLEVEARRALETALGIDPTAVIENV
jgi:CO/xanthine dehydrogenase FAD-binding subunit